MSFEQCPKPKKERIRFLIKQQKYLSTKFDLLPKHTYFTCVIKFYISNYFEFYYFSVFKCFGDESLNIDRKNAEWITFSPVG